MTAPDFLYTPAGADFGCLADKTEMDEVEYVRRDPAVLAALPEVQEMIRAETERCIAALNATCDAEIAQAKKLGPMHVPIIISVKHDCIAAIRGTKP